MVVKVRGYWLQSAREQSMQVWELLTDWAMVPAGHWETQIPLLR